jgi:signal transduction histidine kinase
VLPSVAAIALVAHTSGGLCPFFPERTCGCIVAGRRIRDVDAAPDAPRRPSFLSCQAGLTVPLDLAAVAEDALEGRPANGITTTATLGEALVTGDGVLLERLVANLLDNAERYNIAGGTVAISTTAQDATSVLRVVNTGAVVPVDMVESLFLPFTRLDDRTRHDGFGLGLALVSSIANVHNGTVHATAVSTGDST